MADVAAIFPDSYEQSRERFRRDLDLVRAMWPNARLGRHCLTRHEDLTIDWIEAEALEQKKRILFLSAGQHGVEAYVGTAMLRFFNREYLTRMDPRTTGLLFVHTINPWGMRHRRRTNAANVDLNRNFVLEPNAFDTTVNRDYDRLDSFLNPKGPVRSLFLSNLAFLFRLLGRVLCLGPGRLRRAVLLGQYRFPKGIYYGGESIQEETRVLMNLLRQHISEYEQFVHLDMHSGYGPRYQMSVVTSRMAPRDTEILEQQFSYPLVLKTNPTEFYSVQGGMIDYVYTLARGEFPHRRVFAAAFEFGTLGKSVLAVLRSLRAEILENQMHWFGAGNRKVREHIARGLQALNAPQDVRWRRKAVADARQAFQGILHAEGFLPP